MTDRKNVPKLRFAEYVEQWQKEPLSQKMTIFRGASPRPKGDPRYYGGKIPRLMIKDATRDGKYTTPCIDSLTEEGAKKSRYLSAGSVVLSCSGTRVAIPTILKVDACVHDGWLAFKDYINIEPEFLYYLFVKLHERMQGSATTGGVFNNLTTEIMNNLAMSFPAVEEQQKIASFIFKVDKKIDLLTEKKAKLTEYKKGVMQQLFNGKFEKNTQDEKTTFIPPTLRFKADDGSDFPDWEENKLSSLTTKISDGIHSTPIYDEMGDYFFVNGNNLKEGSISIDDNTKRVSSVEAKKHNRPISDNTIFISINGTIGNMAFYDNQPIMLGKSACYINVNPDMVDKIFVYAYLQQSATQFYFTKEVTGSTIKNLSLKAIKATTVMTPTIIEQQRISEFFSVINKKVELADRELEKAKQWKKGLLQQMFV
jgi:type I restriction enzyme S subunit